MSTSNLAVLGCGNIGSAIAKGITKSGMNAKNIILTRRKLESLTELAKAGFKPVLIMQIRYKMQKLFFSPYFPTN